MKIITSIKRTIKQTFCRHPVKSRGGWSKITCGKCGKYIGYIKGNLKQS